jgi:5'-3' exonuclease
MGVKSFSKIFTGTTVTLNQFKNKTIAIDGFVMAYQAALGMKNINALTDESGTPTLYLNVILAKVLNFAKAKIKQVWVFDYDSSEDTEKTFHNPTKVHELKKRSARKAVAIAKIKDLNESKESDQSNIEEKIHQQERASFSMNRKIINDIKIILNCLNITWCDAPKGFEAEEICAMLTKAGVADAVFTTDTDTIIYGATQLIRPDSSKKKMFLYKLKTIMDDNDLTMPLLRKLAVVAGCDHCPKTPGIGPKTILKKLQTIDLTDEQKKAMAVFNRTYNIENITYHNPVYMFGSADPDDDSNPLSDITKHTLLLDWLVGKSFNRDRVKKQMAKVIKPEFLP